MVSDTQVDAVVLTFEQVRKLVIPYKLLPPPKYIYVYKTNRSGRTNYKLVDKKEYEELFEIRKWKPAYQADELASFIGVRAFKKLMKDNPNPKSEREKLDIIYKYVTENNNNFLNYVERNKTKIREKNGDRWPDWLEEYVGMEETYPPSAPTYTRNETGQRQVAPEPDNLVEEDETRQEEYERFRQEEALRRQQREEEASRRAEQEAVEPPRAVINRLRQQITFPANNVNLWSTSSTNGLSYYIDFTGGDTSNDGE